MNKCRLPGIRFYISFKIYVYIEFQIKIFYIYTYIYEFHFVLFVNKNINQK